MPTDDWIDSHSVTCVICGGMADERETIKLWEDQIDPTDPNADLKRDVIESQGQGETHTGCFDYAVKNGADDALRNLEALDRR